MASLAAVPSFMRLEVKPEVVAAHFAAFKENPALQESAQLFSRGMPVAEMVQMLAMNKRVLSAFSGMDAIYPHGPLERGILEKIILCISELNHCQFCVQSHRDITDSLGIGNASATQSSAEEHTPRERLAIEYAMAMHRDSNKVPPELFERLRAHFRDEEIVEVTFLIGFINMLNWFNNALEVRYTGEFKTLDVT